MIDAVDTDLELEQARLLCWPALRGSWRKRASIVLQESSLEGLQLVESFVSWGQARLFE